MKTSENKIVVLVLERRVGLLDASLHTSRYAASHAASPSATTAPSALFVLVILRRRRRRRSSNSGKSDVIATL